MGTDRPSGQSPPAAKEVTSPCSTRTRSKTAAMSVQVDQTRGWESIDGKLSILTSPTVDPPKAGAGKRKRASTAKAKSEMEDQKKTPLSTPKKRKTASPKKEDEEKRLRHFRSHAPSTYLQRLERAQSQRQATLKPLTTWYRMFVINRTRNPDPETPSETISMAGTTGNIYDITIAHLPSCTCPDNRKGNQCKHIVYVLHNVLKASSHLQYQLAFLTSELHLIFDQAPLPAAASASDTDTSTGATSSNRKEITGDCPICFMEFSPSTEEIIYCKAACGNNIHKDCFEQWARAQSSGSGGVVKCVYCRTPWERDEGDFEHLVKEGKKGGEGYVNIGEELGLSGRRDYSSYHPFWVRKRRGRRGW
ncbi:MAG: hypothetical protein Q9209_003963 [Squamulea sp. 1 TL-2023]